jgi:hypothetical protein
MIRCSGCYSSKSLDEVDTDGYCYDCANGWPDDRVQMANIRELAEGTVEKLAEARGVTVERMTTELVYGKYTSRPSGGSSPN